MFRRKEGHNGEFEADCEIPDSESSTDHGKVENTCRWSCAKSNCPCYSCPNGYVRFPFFDKLHDIHDVDFVVV